MQHPVLWDVSKRRKRKCSSNYRKSYGISKENPLLTKVRWILNTHTKNRLFNIQNGQKDEQRALRLPAGSRSALTDNHTWALEHDKRTRVYRYARIHFRETQTEFVNVRLKLICRINGNGVQRDPLSSYHNAMCPCGCRMLNSVVSVCVRMVRQILLDFHKLLFLSNASFAAPENVERMFHIRREDERETGKFSSSLMSNSEKPICAFFARTSASIRDGWELRGK